MNLKRIFGGMFNASHLRAILTFCNEVSWVKADNVTQRPWATRSERTKSLKTSQNDAKNRAKIIGEYFLKTCEAAAEAHPNLSWIWIELKRWKAIFDALCSGFEAFLVQHRPAKQEGEGGGGYSDGRNHHWGICSKVDNTENPIDILYG